MSSKSPCFPIIQQINDFRRYCWEINYNDRREEAPLADSIKALIGHKVFSVISIPANMVGIAVGSIGTLGSCCLAAIKISVHIFSGNRCTFPTGFIYFSSIAGKSFIQILDTISENIVEYGYRMSSVFDKVICPKGEEIPPLPYNALPYIQELNDKRATLRKGQIIVNKWFTHKLISIVNIPLNFAATAVSGVGTGISLTLIICKIALYILTGIKIRTSFSLEYLAKATLVSGYQLVLNIGENGKDLIVLIGDIVNLIGMNGALGRARDFAAHPFTRFREELLGEIYPTAAK